MQRDENLSNLSFKSEGFQVRNNYEIPCIFGTMWIAVNFILQFSNDYCDLLYVAYTFNMNSKMKKN